MARKKQPLSDGEKTKKVFPSHAEIDRMVERELKFYGRSGKYPLSILDFLINSIGCEIELGKDCEELGKDEEYCNPQWYAGGITNGELYYSLYVTLSRMSEEADFDVSSLRIGDLQAFGSALDLAIGLFLDRFEDGDFVGDVVDFWILYKWTCEVDGNSVWSDDNGESLSPPNLAEMTDTDWEYIAEDVKTHFLGDELDEHLELAFQENDQQPHWPNFQEYRRALAYLSSWFDRTRGNSRKPDQE